MTKVLSCVNLKGGVGKTAIAVNIAARAGRLGKKTLLIDVDPQTNATFWCVQAENWKAHAEENGTIADLFGIGRATAEHAPLDVARVIMKDVFSNVDLLPSHLKLFTIDLDIAGVTARERILRRKLQPILSDYDLVVCDCPPNLTIPTQNAIAFSTHYIVPVSPDYLSAIGIALVTTRVQKLSDELERSVDNAGVIFSRIGRHSNHREQIMSTIRSQFGEQVLASELKERVAVSRCAEQHISVFDSNDQEAISEFSAVTGAVLNKIGLT
ncbi:ParA family protein [Bremerella sp.]|uniref:ParA family protein n=1 Tax=Bremerella sp. TaxID=2795602 RepID=UPI00391D0504